MEDIDTEKTKESFESLKNDILKEREKTMTITLNQQESSIASINPKSRFLPKPVSLNTKPKFHFILHSL